MKKIVLVPLDERPCNSRFPAMMPKGEYTLCMPPRSLLGNKKQPADTNLLKDWLMGEISDADYLVVSADMMLYGGIVPSRLHTLSQEELLSRTQFFGEIRAAAPNIKIYAFQLIMRCPAYSSDDEEPQYYARCGEQIHRLGRLTHLERLGRLTREEKEEQARLREEIGKEALDDFLSRREKNLRALMRSLEYVRDGTIDFFVVPQDDSAVYGYTSLDQLKVRSFIKENFLHRRIMMYPSADDTGMTLLARAVNDIYAKQPAVYVEYASAKGPFTVPSFEDRMVDETISYQIMAAGGMRVRTPQECEIFLAVNVGSGMYPDDPDRVKCYDLERNLALFTMQAERALDKGKIVAVADIAQANGGDRELVGLMSACGLLLRVHAYAGWNTSSNTLGTVICQSMLLLNGKDGQGNFCFLLHRYVEDVAYCSYAREYVTKNCLPQLGLDYFHADGCNGRAAECVKETLLRFLQEQLPQVSERIGALEVSLPWSRMFEADIRLQVSKKEDRK